MKFYRVRPSEGRSFRIEVSAENARFITGFEVDAEGSRIEVSATVGQRIRIVERSAAKFTELVENRNYGGLEVAK